MSPCCSTHRQPERSVARPGFRNVLVHGYDEVDLVVLNEVPVDLRTRVLRDGRLLVDRDPSARIAFEVRTRNEAFDLEPVLARYRAARERQA